MILTKKQQEKILQKYIEEKHNTDECSGFIDGINATIELINKLTIPDISSRFSVGDCEELIYYGKLKNGSVNLDDGKKHLDYFLENTFELAERSTRFDVKTAKKVFWDRIVALANYR